eukprot:Skav203587  [mRNA]  locus=scaffold935:183111:184076:+ [translate_table: standard]
MATLRTDEVNGRSAKALKIHISTIVGVSLFQQKLFLEDGSEVVDEELWLTPQSLRLVLLKFLNPDAETEGRLIRACRGGDVQSLQACLEEPQDPSLPFKFSDDLTLRGLCPIHLLADQYYEEDCLDLLLEASVEVNKPNPDGKTPLRLAAQNGHFEAVRDLINADADLDQATEDGTTPLHIAAQNGHYDVVSCLSDAKADPYRAKSNGATPFHVAVQNGHFKVIRYLACRYSKSHREAINMATEDGETPLYLAAQHGHVDIVQCLVKYRADPNKAKNDKNDRWFPACIAAWNYHDEVVRVLEPITHINVGREFLRLLRRED